MADSNHSFTYSSLSKPDNEIRLVQILPPSKETEIHCEISSYPLSTAPRYVALSYTWGRADKDCHIFINGCPVTIRKNLMRFLQEMSTMRRYRKNLFWIDALCINQNNTEERTHQVGLMAQIYRRAHQVFVWLGPEYADSDAAMRVLQKPSKINTKTIWWSVAGSAIRKLCQRPYWSRIWVLQELVLAKDIRLVCGHQVILWAHFSDFLEQQRLKQPSERIGPNGEYEPALNSPGSSMIKQIKGARTAITLLDRMRGSRHLYCSEPRDRIYALLGIVTRGIDGLIPDYDQSIPDLLNAVIERDFCINSPRSLASIRSRCDELAELMNVGVDTIFSYTSDKVWPPQGQPDLRHGETGISLWWIDHYKHESVRDLWARSINESVIRDAIISASTKGENECLECIFTLDASYDFQSLLSQSASETSRIGPIHLAAEKGHETTVRLLLSKEPSLLNLRDDKMRTPLQLAVSGGFAPLTKTLLSIRNVDLRSNDQWLMGNATLSLLSNAARLGHRDVAATLLASDKIDANGSFYDVPPLVAAASEGHLSIIELLLSDPRTHVNAECRAHGTAIYVSAERNHGLVVERLLRCDGIDINLGQTKGFENTPLCVAAANGHGSIVEMLVKRPNLRINKAFKIFAEDGALICKAQTALHMVAIKGDCDTAKLLLSVSGINVNKRDQMGRTPLHYAAKFGHKSMVELLLLQTEVNVNAIDVDSRTPLQLTLNPGCFDDLDSLLPKKGILKHAGAAESKLLDTAIKQHCWDVVSLLASHEDIEIDTIKREARSADHLAITPDCIGVAKLLLSKESVDLETFDKERCTPLHSAVRSGCIDIAKILISRGCFDINARDVQGQSALHIAIANDCVEILGLLLLQPGLQVSGKNKRRETPLDLALRTGNQPAVNLLRSTGKAHYWKSKGYLDAKKTLSHASEGAKRFGRAFL